MAFHGRLAAILLFAMVWVHPAHAGVLIQNPPSLECISLPTKEPLTGPYSLPCAATGLAHWSVVGGHIISDVYQVVTGGNAEPVCMDLAGGVPGDPVVLNACARLRPTQRWVIDRGHIVNHHLDNTLCLSRVNGKGHSITTETCIFAGGAADAQTWALY